MYQENPLRAFQAMGYWFENKDIDQWLAKYNGGGAFRQEISKTIDAHLIWCKENKIHYTPTTLIAGYIFPHEYDTMDINLFMEDLKTIVSEPKIQPDTSEALT